MRTVPWQFLLLLTTLLYPKNNKIFGERNTCNTPGSAHYERQYENRSVLPPKRAHHALVYDEGNGVILLTAGSTPVDSGKSFEFYNDLWAFDGKRWKEIGTAGDKRSGIALAYDSRQAKVASFGGFSGNRPLADLRLLNAGEWKTISDVKEMSVAEPGFVYDKDRNVFVCHGGSKERGVANGSTFEWDGTKWKEIGIPGPGERQAFAMVFDSKRSKTILFGGISGSGERYNDTWEYDGARWSRIDTLGPVPRISAGSAYDSKRGLFIIFGGAGANGMLGDTWGWDGKSWAKLAESGPTPRAMGYMAYDKKRDRIVLFGGRLKWLEEANDTWEWDGKKWTKVT